MGRNRWLVILLLLATAVSRLYGLITLSPPGLEHDEVANWLIDRSILAGNHAIYFTQAYGHEAGFHYIQAAFVALLGDHALALRLPAAFAGLLGTAVSYALIKQLFGKKVALTATALLAVLFFPVFYSRLALRAILLPLFSALSAFFWWRQDGKVAKWQSGKVIHPTSVTPSPPHPLTPSLLSGLFAGLSLHTYMAARAVPIFYGLYTIYLALFHRHYLRQRWRGILLFWIVFGMVAAPLLIFLQTNVGAEFRITEIDAPLRALLAGDFRPVWENGIKIMGMFGFQGDPLWRQGVAQRPLLDPLLALTFYAGLIVTLTRLRDRRFAFVLLWLATAVTPSLVTINAPSSIRMINLLPFLTVIPALFIHNIPHLSTNYPKLSTKIAYLLTTLLFLFHIYSTSIAIFQTWPQNEEVQFVWQAALTDIGNHLNHSPDSSPVAIGGWSPATMDPPTMALTLRRDNLSLRHFGSDSLTEPITTLIIPAPQVGQTIRLARPTVRQLHPQLEAQLQSWATVSQPTDNFTLYKIPSPLKISPQNPTGISFDNELRLLGYNSALNPQSSALTFITYWQVITPPTTPRRFFLHALDADGAVVTQHDGLDAPAIHWQAGDILLQAHTLFVDDVAGLTFNLGMYETGNGRRLLTDQDKGYVQIFIRP